MKRVMPSNRLLSGNFLFRPVNRMGLIQSDCVIPSDDRQTVLARPDGMIGCTREERGVTARAGSGSAESRARKGRAGAARRSAQCVRAHANERESEERRSRPFPPSLPDFPTKHLSAPQPRA